MSDRLTQIAAVVTMLRDGQIASYEAVAQVLEIMNRNCGVCDPTPHFSPDERLEINLSGCPLFVAGLKEVLPDHLPEVEVRLILTTPGYGFRHDDEIAFEGELERVPTT